ncbi:hypothetical protein [uncultured Exiguobacterium sp.]|uniref:hypothetical protein n=1 Tax=uncultured Exiguobacterium sp. TaxID=202669 RepID=UPI003749D35E
MNRTYVRKRRKLQHENLQTTERKQEVEFWVTDQLRQRRDGSIRKVINTRRVEDMLKVWLKDHVRLSKAETIYHS